MQQHTSFLKRENAFFYRYQSAYSAPATFTSVSTTCTFDIASRIAILGTLQQQPDSATLLNNYGLPLLIAAQNDGPIRRSVSKYIEGLAADHQVSSFSIQDTLCGGNLSALSAYYMTQPNGWTTTLSFTFESCIDLRLSEPNLWAGVRKRYRSLINKSLRSWQYKLYTADATAKTSFQEFQDLHQIVAGRVTRNQTTWDIQWAEIVAGNAFVIEARDPEGVLIAASLFTHIDETCIYFTSVAKRELFDTPINHGIMWLAIQHAKQIGCKHFHLGQSYFAPHQVVDAKNQGIAKFKSGFGGNVVTSALLSMSKNVV